MTEPDFYVGNPLRARDVPPYLDFAGRRAWDDIIEASEVRHRLLDYHAGTLGHAAMLLAAWRRGRLTPDYLRLVAAWLKDFGVPKAARRRLLVPRSGPRST